MTCLLVAGPLNEKNLAVKLRQNPKNPVSSLSVFYGLHGNYQ
jgi:hypothetical protein